MSSAANEERGHLEDEFQRRMHDAEASPSPDLWSRIDHDLTIQESRHYKGRMVLYRQLAAACFVLFVMAGALLTYSYKSGNNTDANITAVPLDIKKGSAASETAIAENMPGEQAGHKPTPAVPKQSVVSDGKPIEGLTQKSRSVGRKSIASIGENNKQPANAEDANNTLDSGSGGVTLGATESEQSIAAVSKFSALTNDQSITDSPESDVTIRNSISSRFGIGEAFFQTARQAITSVPPSVISTPDQGMANAGRTRSLVEISKAAVADHLDKQEKAKELAIALNSATPGVGKEDKEAAKDNRWSLGLGYAPSYFNQNITMPGQMMSTVSRMSLIADGPDKTDKTSANMNKARDEFEANTDPAFSFAAEVRGGVKVGRKFKVLAGIGFTQNTARTKSSYIIKQFLYKPGTNERVAMPVTTVFLPSLNNNFTTDSLSVSKTDEFYVNYRYRHITLPVGLQYEGNINKDWFWYTAGGIAANFLVETTVMASNNEVRDVSYGFADESPFRKVQFSGNVSAGLGKQISNTVSVTAGPEFRGYLNSLLAEPDKALAPQGNPYTIGINMSVNYNLGQK